MNAGPPWHLVGFVSMGMGLFLSALPSRGETKAEQIGRQAMAGVLILCGLALL